MARRATEFRVVEGEAQTVLRRSFDAPRERVFDAWTDAATVSARWGPP